MEKETKRFETLAVHAGVHPDPSTGAIMTPIFATSTYVQKSPGEHQGYDYSRAGNPTRTALCEALAALEGAKHAIALSSGCAASDTVMHLLEPGDHILCCDDVYGGSSRLFRTIWGRHGTEVSFVDFNQGSIVDYMTAKTKVVWIETPSNPLLKVFDIGAISKAAHDYPSKPIVVVDNTFASPFFQRPLEHGADVVLHSTTKYLNGHSDVIGGALVTNDSDLYEKLNYNHFCVGGVPGPFDCFLVLRGLKTLALRMKRHEENALEIAKFLESHSKVDKVLYPGLPSHPQHEIAKKQMSGFGGMLTFFVKGDLNTTRKLVSSMGVFSLAESLGGVESLIEHPAIMTHASLPAETRQKLGISDTLVRLSIGVENVEDLKADLDQALNFG